MSRQSEIERRLRYRILGMLHSGRLQAGQRLPSIRSTASETGVDHRAVAEAYRKLAEEGLVEIRPGSGVYVAAFDRVDPVGSERSNWLVEVLTEGWRRGIPRAELSELVRRCGTARMVCACVESNRDHMVALAAELAHDLSLEVREVMVDPDLEPGDLDPSVLAGADLAATSVFLADAVRPAAVRAGIDFVPLTLNPVFTAELDTVLSRGGVTAVILDPRLAARGDAHFAVTAFRDRVRYVLANRVAEEGVDLDSPDVLITRAARRALGLDDYHLLPPPLTLISPQSARAIHTLVVQREMGRAG